MPPNRLAYRSHSLTQMAAAPTDAPATKPEETKTEARKSSLYLLIVALLSPKYEFGSA